MATARALKSVEGARRAPLRARFIGELNDPGDAVEKWRVPSPEQDNFLSKTSYSPCRYVVYLPKLRGAIFGKEEINIGSGERIAVQFITCCIFKTWEESDEKGRIYAC